MSKPDIIEASREHTLTLNYFNFSSPQSAMVDNRKGLLSSSIDHDDHHTHRNRPTSGDICLMHNAGYAITVNDNWRHENKTLDLPIKYRSIFVSQHVHLAVSTSVHSGSSEHAVTASRVAL